MTAHETENPIEHEIADGVATVTLARPASLNALNTPLRLRFREVMGQLEEDDAVRVVVIRGAGERAFSAGADLKEIGTRTAMERRAMYAHEPSAIVREFPKPVIAAIRGYALGGGLELASACDIRVAAADAKIGYPEIKHGWVPAGGGTQTLPRLVGMGRAMEMILTGRLLDADEALAAGLVQRVHPVEGFDEEVRRLAEEIASRSLGVLLLAKSALRMAEETGRDAGHRYERELGSLMYTLEGRDEALRSFTERGSGRGEKA